LQQANEDLKAELALIKQSLASSSGGQVAFLIEASKLEALKQQLAQHQTSAAQTEEKLKEQLKLFERYQQVLNFHCCFLPDFSMLTFFLIN